MRLLFALITSLLIFPSFIEAQSVTVEGYVYEGGNRGYLNLAFVEVLNKNSKAIIGNTMTNKEGVFHIDVPLNGEYDIRVSKDLFNPMLQAVSTIDKNSGEKVFLKYEMKRVPGYIFDVTIAEKKQKGKITDAITGTKVEVYNNTSGKEELVIDNNSGYTFKTHFEQGNHYTVLIRKDKYFNKRMEAFVNVEGCILCFEGVGEVKPSDVLTEGNEMGTLLANVEMTPIELNKGIKIENIYYDSGRSSVRKEGLIALDQLILVLKNNPSMVVEIGSHTDSNGKDDFNSKLSEKRAKNVVDYLVNRGEIDRRRLIAKGYGESKLVNNCGNNIDCDEEKHQQNRRTELKIVGFVEDNFENKSLAQILEEEKFLQMLKEVESSEELKVTSETELPDEIKASIKSDSTKLRRVIESVPVKTENPEVKKIKTYTAPVKTGEGTLVTNSPDEYNNPVNIQPVLKDSKDLSNFPGNTKEIEPVITVPIPQAEVLNEFGKTVIEAEKEPEILVLDPMDAPSEYNEVNEDFDKEEEEMTTSNSSRQIFGEFPIQVNIVARAPKHLPRSYTGYRVQFFNSSYELPVSHEIFSRHGNITIEQKKDGTYGYLLGDFEDWRDANRFLSTILSHRYNDATVIRYKKGNRILE